MHYVHSLQELNTWMWMEYNVSPHLINLSLHLGKIQSPARVLFLTVFKIVCARKTAVGSVRSVHS